jgi:hypothetical protein
MESDDGPATGLSSSADGDPLPSVMADDDDDAPVSSG